MLEISVSTVSGQPRNIIQFASVKMQSSIMGKFVFLNMNNGEFLLDRIMVCRLSSSPLPALCYAGSWSCEEQRSVM